MLRLTLVGGVGALGSAMARFFHPSQAIRDKWPNDDKRRLAGVLVIGEGMRRVNHREQMCYLVRIDDLGEDIVCHIVKKNFKITQAPLVPFPSEVTTHAAPASICTPYQIGTLPILRLRLRRERKAATKGRREAGAEERGRGGATSQSNCFVPGTGRFIPRGPQRGALLMGGGGGGTPLVGQAHPEPTIKSKAYSQKNGDDTTIKSEGGEDEGGGCEDGAVRGKGGGGGGDECGGRDNKEDRGGAEEKSEVKAEEEEAELEVKAEAEVMAEEEEEEFEVKAEMMYPQ